MKKNTHNLILFFALLFFSIQLNAQSVEVEIKTNGDVKKENIELPQGMTYPMDSLLKDWHVKTYIDINGNCKTSSLIFIYSTLNKTVKHPLQIHNSMTPFTLTGYNVFRQLLKCLTIP